MNKFFSKSFKVGIFIGILSYVVIYVYGVSSATPTSKSICFDCEDPTGFPFPSYQAGNAITLSHTLWFGLIANILVAILFIFGMGFLFSVISSKISSRNLK